MGFNSAFKWLISELCCSIYYFVSIVLFYVLFVCKCVLYYWHWVSTQLQLNISHHFVKRVKKKHKHFSVRIAWTPSLWIWCSWIRAS